MPSIVREDLQSDHEIVIERLIAAPRDVVWNAWAQLDQIEQWWGPDGFTTTTYERDFRAGGIWRFTMHGPDGRDYENRIDYLEVVENERIVDSHGGAGETAHIRFRAEITFEDADGGTLVRMRSIFPTAEMREMVAREFGAVEGGQQTLARLAAMVEKMA